MSFCILNKKIANIKIVLSTIVIIFLVLIFPIFINLNLRLSFNEKNLKFKIYLFGFIKILSGYAHLIEEGIIIHLTKYTAIIVEKEKFFTLKDKVKPLKDYHFIKINIKLELGSNQSILTPLITAFLFNYVENIFTWFMYFYKPQLNSNNCINIYENRSIFNVAIKLNVVFNFLMVLISLIKIIMEKIICKLKTKATE